MQATISFKRFVNAGKNDIQLTKLYDEERKLEKERLKEKSNLFIQ